MPSGDSGKIIRGSEFETEFDNIATAIATKADAADPTFTGTVTIDGLTVNGNTTLGNAATDTVTVTADIASNLIPSADDTYNLGASGAEWNDLFIDGTANIDSLVADTADINGGTIDGVTIGGSSAGAITGTTITGTSFVTSGNMTFGDNDKAIFGAGNDLQIYHDGSNSYVTDEGTGSLYLRGSSQVRVETPTGENMAIFNDNGAVSLRYNNAKKFETTSSGVNVTGTVVADGLTSEISTTGRSTLATLANTANLTAGNQATIQIKNSGQSAFISGESVQANAGMDLVFSSNNGSSTETTKMRLAENGDVSFYEDTGTTAKFFWDASQERLELDSANANVLVLERNGGTDANVSIQFNCATNDWYAGTNPANNFAIGTSLDQTNALFQIDASGNVGIGTDSPSTNLEISDSSGAELRLTNSSTSLSQGSLIGALEFYNSDTSGINPSVASSVKAVASSGGGAYGDLTFSTIVPATEGADATEAMRIDSSGNVGIGTDSPAGSYTKTLHIHGSGTGASLHLTDPTSGATASDGLEVFQYGNDGYIWEREAGNLRFGTSASERMRIDSSGNVGIGTSSPSKKLHIKGSTITGATADTNTLLYLEQNANNSIQINSGSSNNGQIRFGDASSNYRGALTYQHSDDSLQFVSAGAERMRIDSSGNLLVGKTGTSFSTDGAELKSDGQMWSTRNNGTALSLNRLTSDGSLVGFYKDSTTVGSIGVNSSNILQASSASAGGLFLADNGTNLVGFANSENAFRPAGDNTVDLGKTDRRWKNLYLSGGAYLGGTAAANKLDDYEEGTFTPVYEPTTGSFTTMTMDIVEAKYTKIGNAVTISLWVRTDNVDTTGASGALRLAGLPFNSNSYTSMAIGNSAGWGGDQPAYAFTGGPGVDYITLQYKTAINAEPNNISTTDLQTGAVANQNQVFISGTYFTSA